MKLFKSLTERGRKFYLAILSMLLITIVCIVGFWFPIVSAVYPTFIGGVLGILSLYLTGNVMSKHVGGNNAAKLEKVKKESSGE